MSALISIQSHVDSENEHDDDENNLHCHSFEFIPDFVNLSIQSHRLIMNKQAGAELCQAQ